jgi:hypothetical protein
MQPVIRYGASLFKFFIVLTIFAVKKFRNEPARTA